MYSRQEWQPDGAIPASEAWMASAASLLERGEVIACRPVRWSSNHVFLVDISADGSQATAIYKPCAGEAPLYDFPLGTLYRREYAAYLVSQALGWRLVPPTVVRHGTYGVGSVQWYVAAGPESSYFSLRQTRVPELQRIAVFDCLVNNADRKAGHCLKAPDGRLWAIDHGLTFNAIPKLRTVVWDFAGQPIPAELLADLASLRQLLSDGAPLPEVLLQLLSPVEVGALRQRLEGLVAEATFPQPGPYRCVPWPMV